MIDTLKTLRHVREEISHRAFEVDHLRTILAENNGGMYSDGWHWIEAETVERSIDTLRRVEEELDKQLWQPPQKAQSTLRRFPLRAVRFR